MNQQQQSNVPNDPFINENFNLTKATHPILCLLHLGLKLAAMFSYLFLYLIVSSQIYTFISVITLLAVDFWTTKNVTGRVLIGMRWWNGEDDTEQEGWYFESYDIKIDKSPVDSYVFWWGMIISAGFWGIMLMTKLIGFSLFWGMLVLIGFSLNATNLYGYYLCKQDHEEKLRNILQKFGGKYQPVINALRESFKLAQQMANNK